MNLAARRSARQRNNFVMRLGCVLVSVSVVVSLIVTPPKAKAVAATSAAASALAGAYLDACGLSPVVSGMGSSQDVNAALARLIQDYLSTIGSPTAEEWLGQELGLAVSGGKIYLPRSVAGKLGEFAVWVGDQFKTGLSTIYSGYSAPLVDGSTFTMSHSAFSPVPGISDSTPLGLIASVPLVFSSGYSVVYGISASPNNKGYISLLDPNGVYIMSSGFVAASGGIVNQIASGFIGIGIDFEYSSAGPALAFYNSGPRIESFQWIGHASVKDTAIFLRTMTAGDFALDVTDHWQDALDRITSLEEQQTIALDVGATDSMAIQEILQNILDAILAGTLTVSASDKM